MAPSIAGAKSKMTIDSTLVRGVPLPANDEATGIIRTPKAIEPRAAAPTGASRGRKERRPLVLFLAASKLLRAFPGADSGCLVLVNMLAFLDKPRLWRGQPVPHSGKAAIQS